MFSKYEEDDSKRLPEFEEGEKIKHPKLDTLQKFTNPPLRYNESRLIGKMKELGIGRPSTYAVTIETLKARNYVKLEKKAFVPTPQGILTSDKLQEYFASIINIEYTADLEKDLDNIADGNAIWHKEVEEFYNDYKPLLDNADEKMVRMYPIETEEICPECGGKLVNECGCIHCTECGYSKCGD